MNKSLPRRSVNSGLVNGCAPELFPVTVWLESGLLGAKRMGAAPLIGQPYGAVNA
jgi:hypothetical protein